MPEIVPSSDERHATDQFVANLTGLQADLWAFLGSLMPGDPDLADVVQKTNLVIWRKSGQFEPGTNFRAWVFKIARYEMLNHLRNRRRQNTVELDERLADLIACEFSEILESRQNRMAALEECLQKVRPEDRLLLSHRYGGGDLGEYAKSIGRSVSGLSVTLFRLRDALRRCVETRLSEVGGES